MWNFHKLGFHLWHVLFVLCREFTSKTLETKTKKFSHTVPVSFRKACVICKHTITTSPLALCCTRDYSWTMCHLCINANMNKSATLNFLLLCLYRLRERHDIVSVFDFFNLSVQLLDRLSFLARLSPTRLPRGVLRRDSNCSCLGRSPHHDFSPKTSGRSHSPSITFSESSLSLSQRKAKVRSGTI